MRFYPSAFQLNWRFAFGQVLLTALGVALALGGNGWRTERQERAREGKYLQQLKADLRATRISIDTTLAAHLRLLSVDTLVLASLRDTRPLTADSVDRWVLGGTWMTFQSLAVTTSTARALAQSGEGSLLKEDTLRIRIASFVSTADRIESSLTGYAAVFRPLASELMEFEEMAALPAGPNDRRHLTARAIMRSRSDARFRALVYKLIHWRLSYIGRLIEMRAATDSLAAQLK